MSTPTPRTDYEEQRLDAWQAGERFVKSSLARALETELTAALARVAELEKDCLNNIEAHAKLSYQKNSEIDSLTRQLSESQAQLAKRAENVSPEEANELRDVLRTLVPSGRAFITSARELVQRWEGQKTEIQTLSAQLASAREDSARLDWYALNWEKVFQRVCISGWWFFNESTQRQEHRETLRSAIDAARGHLAETPAGGETGKASTELASRLAEQRDTSALYLSRITTLCRAAKEYANRVLLSGMAKSEYRFRINDQNAHAVSEASANECEALEKLEGLIKAFLPPPPQGNEQE